VDDIGYPSGIRATVRDLWTGKEPGTSRNYAAQVRRMGS